MQKFIEHLSQFRYFQRNARLYLLANALSGMTFGIIVVLYPLYLSALGYGTDFIGLLLLSSTLGASVAIFPAGLCIDRFSGKAILIWSSLLVGVGSTGVMLLHHPVALCSCAFVTGIGVAFVFVLNAPFLMKNSTPVERVHLFSINIVIALVTVVLGEVFGGALPVWLREHPWAMLPKYSWLLLSEPLARSYQITLLFASLLSLPSLIPLFLMTNDRPGNVRQTADGGEKSVPLVTAWSRAIFGTLLAWSRAISGALNARSRAASSELEVSSPLRAVKFAPIGALLLSPMAVMVIVNALLNFGAGMLIPYLGLFFVKNLGATSAHFGVIDGAANMLNAAVTLFGPWVAMRIGRVIAIILPRMMSIPVLLCMGIFPILPLAAVLYLLRQGLIGIPNSLWQVFSMEVVPSERRGLANSSYQSANKIAWAASVPLGGVLISRLGYVPVFWISTVFYVLSMALFWWRFSGKRFVTPAPAEEDQGELTTVSTM